MCLALTSLAVGCAQLRPYSEVRDKQGQAAQAAWSKVDADAAMVAERANLQRLLKTELDTQDKLALSIRDHTLRSLVEAPSLKLALFDAADATLQKLVGPDGANSVPKAAAHHAAIRQWDDALHTRQESIAWRTMIGLPAPTCAAFKPMAANVPADTTAMALYAKALAPQATDTSETTKAKLVAAGVFEDIGQHCQQNPHYLLLPFASMGGAMQVAWQRKEQEARAMQVARRTSQSLVADYNEAVREYQTELGATSGSSTDKVKAALAKASHAASQLEKAQNAFSTQFIAKQRLEALNDFVSVATQGLTNGELPTNATQAVVALALFPHLIDSARQSLRDAKAPLALPLLIQRDQSQLQLEAANREVAALEAQARLSQLAVDTLFAQARQVWLAQREFAAAVEAGVDPDKPTLAAFNTGSTTAKASMYRGAGLYLDAINRWEARRYKVEYQHIAAIDERKLAYAETSAKQWAALIDATVDQLAQAGGAGIKADSLSAMLNTAGVFYIGHGANK